MKKALPEPGDEKKVPWKQQVGAPYGSKLKRSGGKD